MIKSAGEILIKEIGDAIKQLRDCTAPLFDVNDKGEAELLGSSVLITVSDNTFLCTAKHVIDGNQKSTIYFDGKTKLEILEGDFVVSQEHDVAMLKLTSSQLEDLEKYRPLQESQIADQEQTASSKYVQFLGFPATKNRKSYLQNKIKGLRQSNGCSIIKITPTRVHVSFNTKKNINTETRQRVTAADPYGMSGGAMFGAVLDADTIAGNPIPKLIGISTDKLGNDEVFGTTISIVLAIIRDGWQMPLPERLNPTNIITQ